MTREPAYHIYLVSSLPALHFGAKPPFSSEKFLQICRGLIPDEEIRMIERATLADSYASENPAPSLPREAETPSTEKMWRAFDISLRNELAKVRASRKKIDPARYLRGEAGYASPAVTRMAMSAYRNQSIVEAERTLDRARWRMLDELTVGHYFDIEFLVLYAHKLLILERWEKIRTSDGHRMLEEALG